MSRINGLLAALALLVVPAGLLAQDSVPSTRHALIREVMQLTRVAEQSLSVMEKAVEGQRAMNPDIPGVFWDRFLVRAKEEIGELLAMLVPVYEEAFSLEDLQGLVAFYRSPVGRRLMAAQPTLVQASMEVGERWGARLGAEVGEEIQNSSATPR